MTDKLTIGFIPLVDAASILIARDFGFAEEEGLDLQLRREVSWSNIREKLSAGLFDAAHMLAPMAMASALDVMPAATLYTAPYILSFNGNAITVSRALLDEMVAAGGELTPEASARTLAGIAEKRQRDGLAPLSFGTTFPFSCHTYLLRAWMALDTSNTLDDVRIVTLPPPLMVESLRAGDVDGFCVGAPWNSVAVEARSGHILHLGCDIFPRHPEKVLAAGECWASRNTHLIARLLRAISAAATFTNKPENWDRCVERLSASDRINAPPELIRRALSGVLQLGAGREAREDRRYLILADETSARPDPSNLKWLFSQLVEWNQAPNPLASHEAALGVFSAGLFDQAFSRR